MPLIFFPFLSSILWNKSRFYYYLCHILRIQEMRAKTGNSNVVNNFSGNFEGESFCTIQNWINQLDTSEKLRDYQGATHWLLFLLSHSFAFFCFSAKMQWGLGKFVPSFKERKGAKLCTQVIGHIWQKASARNQSSWIFADLFNLPAELSQL